MAHLPIIIADVDWVRLAIFLVIGVAYVINFIASRLRDRQIAKNRPHRPAQPKADTAKELEEFLKKSSARRDTTTAKAAPATPVGQGRQDGGRGRGARRKSDDRDKRRKAQPSAAAPTLVNLRESALTRDADKTPPVAPLQPSIDTRKFSERASHLGASHLSSLDTEHSLEDHLKQTFSHKVGSLAQGMPAEVVAAQSRVAGGSAGAAKQPLPIAALLREGAGARTAIVLNEILNRPEERW
jgi:hypothetical protein